jgi:predicted MPP superfamily phosphohydrolase
MRDHKQTAMINVYLSQASTMRISTMLTTSKKAGSGIPSNEFSILLSHTPEIYQQAAHADFSLLLSGHTHGGQICLPGRIPITLDSVLPRYMGSGFWTNRDTNGYTSVGVGCSIVPVRFNCPPEITLHFLQSIA